MSISISLDELIGYSNHERAKWRQWLSADPQRMALPFQTGGRFETVGSLFAHIFLVERRHLSRLEGSAIPDTTGVDETGVDALFEYGATVRAALSSYVQNCDDATASTELVINVPAGTYTFSRRKLAVHILMHEIRHLAQVAAIARAEGLAPPGEHDLFFYPGLR